jgi:hypothetical protein
MLYLTKPSLWHNHPLIEGNKNTKIADSITGYHNERPVFTDDYEWCINLFTYSEYYTPARVYYTNYDPISVKDWKLPPITDPNMIQLVVFLSGHTARKGKNVKSIMVPVPDRSLSSGSPGSEDTEIPDWPVPGSIVFGLMFLGLGLAGAAAGAAGQSGSGKSADDSENKDSDRINDKSSDEEETDQKAHIFCETSKDSLLPGEKLRLTLTLHGTVKDEFAILNAVSLVIAGEASNYISIENAACEAGLGFRSFDISFNYKLDSEFYQGDHELVFPQNTDLQVKSSVRVENSVLRIVLNAPEPEICLNQKTIILAENSHNHPKLKAWVKAVDDGEWDFALRPIKEIECAVANAVGQKTSNRECEIKIESVKMPEGSGRSITSDLEITARNKKTQTTVSTKIPVTVAREGLILVSPAPIRIAADGETTSEIEITAIKASEGRLITDLDLLTNLRISDEILTSSEHAAKGFATAKLEFLSTDSKLCWKNLNGPDTDQIATYTYRLKTQRLLPGQGESLYAHAVIKSGSHSLTVPVMLDVDLMQPESRGWEIELERCRLIIDKLPEKHRARLHDMVNKRARFLGAKGLYELRKNIWAAGQTLWEAEGLSGYESVEQWSGYIENSLNFAQWSGRMATDILLTYKLKMGVFAAMAAGEIYDLVLSGIIAYRDNKSFDDWLEESFWLHIKQLCIGMGSALLDPDKFVKKFGNNKKVIAIAWSVQFGYYFLANLTVHDMAVIDAAKKAAVTVATAAALRFLAHKAAAIAKKKKLNLKKIDDNLDDAAEQGWKKAKEKVAGFEDAIKKGDKASIKQKMLDIQSDKFALKEINKWPKDIRSQYNREIGKLYASIDNRVKKKIIQNLKKQGLQVSNKNIKMTNATNSSNRVKVGSDRDISVEYSFVDKNGKTVTLEYPKDKLRDVYGREFYRSVGHKNAGDMMPDELMEKYDQYALDSRDAEAYGTKRMNYQTGKVENLDFKRAIDKNGLPQKFDDGGQIGMTASYKSKEWFNKASDAFKNGNRIEAESFKMEGMSQLTKQFKNIYEPRKGLLDMMGKPVADDGKMRELMGLMDKAVRLEKSPSYVENLVKKNGFASLKEFADAFGSKIATMNDMMG